MSEKRKIVVLIFQREVEHRVDQYQTEEKYFYSYLVLWSYGKEVFRPSFVFSLPRGLKRKDKELLIHKQEWAGFNDVFMQIKNKLGSPVVKWFIYGKDCAKFGDIFEQWIMGRSGDESIVEYHNVDCSLADLIVKHFTLT